MRMRQNIADFESAFEKQMEAERLRAERIRRETVARARRRRMERVHTRGTMRFWLLVLTLLATAVIVTIAMFQTLYIVMG